MSASTNPSLRDRLALAQQLFEQFYLQGSSPQLHYAHQG